MRDEARHARRPSGAVMWPLVAWVVMAAVGYVPTRSVGGRAGVVAMLVAQAIVVVTLQATLLPTLARMVKADAGRRFHLALRVGVIRWPATVVVIAIVAWLELVDRVVFLVWAVITYVVLIQIDAVVLASWNRRLEKQP